MYPVCMASSSTFVQSIVVIVKSTANHHPAWSSRRRFQNIHLIALIQLRRWDPNTFLACWPPAWVLPVPLLHGYLLSTDVLHKMLPSTSRKSYVYNNLPMESQTQQSVSDSMTKRESYQMLLATRTISNDWELLTMTGSYWLVKSIRNPLEILHPVAEYHYQ